MTSSSLPLNVERWTLNVERFLLPLLLFFPSFGSAQDSTSGYGPPTAVSPNESMTAPVALPPRNWIDQTQAQADAKSIGCIECHQGVEPMHAAPNVVLGCTDCHGGNPTPGLTQTQGARRAAQSRVFWESSANPTDSLRCLLNHESPEFIRFVNPGDLRVAEKTCGLCHQEIVHNVGTA